MNDVIRAQLPADLADELVGKGFEEYLVFRGVLADAGTVMTMASASLAIGANIATVIVSREEVGKFIAAVRDWVRRKAAGKPGGEMTIDFAARQGDCVTRVHVRVESQDGVPEIDTAALAAFITSAFPRNAVEDASATSE
jgi:hypothetical protein